MIGSSDIVWVRTVSEVLGDSVLAWF